MVSHNLLLALAALSSSATAGQALNNNPGAAVAAITARQAVATTTSTDTAQCELPQSLRDQSIYANQPDGSQDLSNFLRALPCVPVACCIPPYLSADWASYTSSASSWWSASSSIFQQRDSDVASFYSSIATVPACAPFVNPLAPVYSNVNPPDDPLGLECPKGSENPVTPEWASPLYTTGASTAAAMGSAGAVTASASASTSSGAGFNAITAAAGSSTGSQSAGGNSTSVQQVDGSNSSSVVGATNLVYAYGVAFSAALFALAAWL